MTSRFLTQVTAYKQLRDEMLGKDHFVQFVCWLVCLGSRDGVQLQSILSFWCF